MAETVGSFSLFQIRGSSNFNSDDRVGSLEQRVARFEVTVTQRFDQLDQRFEKLERRVDQLEIEVYHIRGTLDNEKSIRRNGKLYKLYHRIEPVKANKFNVRKGQVEWSLPQSFPKHLKAFRNLGNHAKGQFTTSELSGTAQSRE